MDVYGIITERIVTLLENGVVPWRRPWTSAGLPRNLVSKQPYRGVNVFLLSASKYVSPFWLTVRQANELSGHVRKGEESTIVVYWKVDNMIQPGEDLDLEKTEQKTRRRFACLSWNSANRRPNCGGWRGGGFSVLRSAAHQGCGNRRTASY